jgi:type IV fimbrial biogenesis protein FimT
MSDSERKHLLSASRKLADVVSYPMNSSISDSGNVPGMSLRGDSGAAARAARLRTAFRGAAGFNMVELLVVTTLASILMAIAVPSYRYVTNSSRVSTEINNLLGDMMLARAEAIRQGLPVTVCPSTPDGKACNNVTDWSKGWIVFTDFNANGTVDTDTANNDTVLRYQQKFSSTDTFTTTNATNNWVTFNRDGFATGLNGSDTTQLLFTLQTVPTNTQWERCLQITRGGQMTTEHVGIGECQ